MRLQLLYYVSMHTSIKFCGKKKTHTHILSKLSGPYQRAKIWRRSHVFPYLDYAFKPLKAFRFAQLVNHEYFTNI